MQVVCESCGAVVPAENIDLERMLAKCEACDHVFNCSRQLQGIGGTGDRTRGEVAMPKGMQVYRRTNGLRITRRWFGPKIIGLLIFCAVWDTFMVVWYTIAITQGIWPMALFGLIHLAVGVGLTYFAIAGLFNTTTITVMHGSIDIRHAPIPVPGKDLQADNLAQLYTKRRVSHSNNGTSITYELRAKQTDGKDIKLLGNLESEEQGLFMENRIEEFLQIQDATVAGEVER